MRLAHLGYPRWFGLLIRHGRAAAGPAAILFWPTGLPPRGAGEGRNENGECGGPGTGRRGGRRPDSLRTLRGRRVTLDSDGAPRRAGVTDRLTSGAPPELARSSRGLARRSATGLVWTGLSMGALGLAETAAFLLLARLLAPEAFGLYAAALVVVKFSAILSNLGVAPAVVQRPLLEDRHLRVGFTISMLLSLVMATAVWLAAPSIAAAMRLPDLAPVVRAASVVCLCQGAATIARASAQRALRFRWLATVEAAAFAVGYLVVGVVLAWLGFGIWSLVGALVTQYVLLTAILLGGSPHPKRLLLDWRTSRELLHFGGGFTLARIFNFAAGQIDRIVVGRWLGAEALGAYALASLLMTTPAVLVGQVLDRVLFPTMALVQGETTRLARAYRSAVAACTIVVLPASALIVILAPELVRVLLGPGWEMVVAPLRILAAGMLFRTSYKLSDCVSRATGAVYARALRQAVFAAAVGVGALVGQMWGLSGVAFGVVAAITLNFLLMAQLSLRLTGLGWTAFLMAHRPGTALAAAVTATGWTLAEVLRPLDLPPLLLLLDVACVAGLATVLLCWLLPAVFLGPDGRSALRLLLNLLPRRLQGAACRLAGSSGTGQDRRVPDDSD